jgi:hypothetical protein
MPMAVNKPESPLIKLLSGKMGDMEGQVDFFKLEYKERWLETPTTWPGFEQEYSLKQKKELERDSSALLVQIEQKQQNEAVDQDKAKETLQQSGMEIEHLCGRAGLYFDKSFTDGFERATKEFLQRAKAFDAKLKPEDIYQAMRNIWIANSLQALMNREMDCSAPVFAYSMLYPYSDNVNDDPELSFAAKCGMNDRFRKWLEGENPPFRNATEQKINALVLMIERDFSRNEYPGVFQSLLGIFNAQIKSLIQQKQHQSGGAADILDISIEKGGTSVLADGYLIRGALDDQLEDFCFGYGVFLQFADDLQDVADDLANGHQTLFSQMAETGPLDALANKLFNFMRRVVDLHLAGPADHRFRELILKNCYFMVQEAICKTAHFYSPGYLSAIERNFPLTLLYYRHLKKQLKQMLLTSIPVSPQAIPSERFCRQNRICREGR